MIRRLMVWVRQLGSGGRRTDRPFAAGSQAFDANPRAARGVDEARYLAEQAREADREANAPDPNSWEARQERGEDP